MDLRLYFNGVLLFLSAYNPMHVVSGLTLGYPQFESSWIPIQAQVSPGELFVPHGLGVVPLLVDVSVKATDGPNNGFIFKATGTAERDDDGPDPYGGVIYIYNDENVRVMTPYGMNHNKQGSALYTGESPYWKGVNTQMSYSVMIKVRCWTGDMLPPPCFNKTGISMQTGSLIPADTFREFAHDINGYPDLVKVRVFLTNDIDAGWYSDGQGAAQMNLKNPAGYGRNGGLKYAYNNETIRVWASTSSYSYLESHIDGWGNDRIYYGYPNTGLVEMRAWCNMSVMFEHRLEFGPSVNNEQFEVNLPLGSWFPETIPLSVTIEAVDGPNKGYRFDGSGSGYTNTINPGTPCAYGGVIYAFTGETLRFWRPDHGLGGAICITDFMGNGSYAQSSLNGVLTITVLRHASLNLVEYEPITLVCDTFTLLRNDTAYNDEPMLTKSAVPNIVSCDSACRQYDTCITYQFYNATCSMYDTTNETLFYSLPGSQLWGLEDRTVTIED